MENLNEQPLKDLLSKNSNNNVGNVGELQSSIVDDKIDIITNSEPLPVKEKRNKYKITYTLIKTEENLFLFERVFVVEANNPDQAVSFFIKRMIEKYSTYEYDDLEEFASYENQEKWGFNLEVIKITKER